MDRHRELITELLTDKKWSKTSIAKHLQAIDPQLKFKTVDSIRFKINRALNRWESGKGKNELDNDTVTDVNDYQTSNGDSEHGAFERLSAEKQDGTIMTIEEYCKFYGLDFEDVSSYKLVTHTQRAFYNVAFRSGGKDSVDVDLFELTKKYIDDHIEESRGVPSPKPIIKSNNNGKIIQLVFTDAHIGMSTDKNGVSLYGGSWSKEDLRSRRACIQSEISGVIAENQGNIDCVQVLNLGDFADGLDGQTVRKGHDLPQNMSNEQVFDEGVQFHLTIYETIRRHVGKETPIIWHNVCNSNHSASFDYFINEAFRGIVQSKDSFTKVVNQKKFIGHFSYGRHTIIYSHGKDSHNLKFGFKAQLDQKGKEKIADYIRFHKLDRLDTFISFYKGDSHQYVVDRTENYSFNSFPALSPSSEWVQTNYGASRSGFSIILLNTNSFSGQERTDYEFEWGSNKLI